MATEKRTETFTVDGDVFEVKKILTIGEEIAWKGRRATLCSGQYDTMFSSTSPDEVTTAVLVSMIAELEARLISAPEGWTPTEETDKTRLMKIFGEMQRALGVAPGGFRGGKEKPSDD